MTSILTLSREKLVVHIAENGKSFELNCNESTLVEEVQRFIESVAGIHVDDQLLLCLDMKLEARRLLSAYKLPSKDKHVFLYNKARLLHDSPVPAPEQIDIPQPTEPPSQHPIDDSYERKSRHNLQHGRAIYNCTKLKYENCERLLKEQKVQERALETARGSMDRYHRIIQQMYMDFMKFSSQQHRYHSDLLASFGRDIEKLRSCKLHPSLQTDTRKCLLDFMKEDNLLKRAENCSSSHRQFEMKVSQLKHMFNELKSRVEELFSNKVSTAIRDLELTIKKHQRHLHDEKSIMQSLSKDVITVKKQVEDYLPKMKSCDRSISKLLEICMVRKNEMNLFVHNYMQKVAYVQFIIKDVGLQFPAFKEAMTRQDDLFADLRLIRGIGPAYRACLAEIVRRKSSMKLYMGMAGQLAEKLAIKRETEVRRRKEFIKAYNIFIPQDILASMGLFDTPNQCNVSLAPFDTKLMEIDIADIDHYAPEYLVGTALRGWLSVTNDGSQSVEVEEISEKHDLEEDCDTVEITGTSKMEVENCRLKAELASAIALICSVNPETEYESLDDSKLDSFRRSTAEKTAEALHLKDEYGKHVQSMLRQKQIQCLSYEKRIQELQQTLSDHFSQKLSGSKGYADSTHSALKADDCKSEISGDGNNHMYLSTEPKVEGVDESMLDSSRMLQPQLDTSMLEPHRDALAEEVFEQENIFTSNNIPGRLNIAPNIHEDPLSELRTALADKSNECSETETKFKAAIEEIAMLRRELENNRKLLDESQMNRAHLEKSNECRETKTNSKAAVEKVGMLGRELENNRKLLEESKMNCAHLEKCLHEAREEAHTNLCAADRRASEYSALRASTVKMRSLFERLRRCVTTSDGIASLADSLRTLAYSLAKSANDKEDDDTTEIRACVQVLADKLGCKYGDPP